MPVPLGRSAAAGARWSVASVAWRHLITAVTSVVLARLLVPADFGLLAMAAVFTRFVDLIRDVGTGAGIVQAREAPDRLVSSLFWLNAGLGIASGAVLFEAAPLAAWTFREPRLAPIVRLLAAAPACAAFAVVPTSLLTRELRWRRLAAIEFFGVLAGASLGVGLAWRGYGVWSLVWQSLSGVFIVSSGIWFATAWRPALVFDSAAIRSVLGFSANLTGFNVLNFGVRYADNLLIGRYLGARDLGYYDLAYRLMLSPLQYVATAFGRALLPIYSKMQDDPRRLGRAYLKVIGVVALLGFPAMIGLAAVSRPLVLATLGAAWLPVASLLIVFGPLGALQSVTTSVAGVYQAVGRTDLLFRWGAISAALTVAAFVAGLPFGIEGVASAYALVSCGLAYPLLAVPLGLVGVSVADVLRAIRAPLAATLVMGGGVLAVRVLAARQGTLAVLLVSVTAGAALYAAVIQAIGRASALELLDLARGR